jgi:negative regulator of flagellin synthesis FlgM
MDTKAVSSGSPSAASLVTSTAEGGAKKAAKGAGAQGVATPAAMPSAAAAPAKAPSNYDVKISDGAKDRATAQAKALEIARQTPDVREDRVADLKKRIADGTYQIDSGKIADGMLHEAIRDHLADTSR